MVKTAGGSYHKDDFIGTTLAGLTVDQVRVIAVECGLDTDKYAHLNPGQIRMTLGNSLRKMTNMTDENGLEGAALDKAIKANVEAEAARDQIEELANDMKEANAKAKADAVAAKEAEKAEKAEKAAAKPAKGKKAKVADDSEGEGDTAE
jgi:Ser-tRNA(Ala) deacylase AlaX